MKTLLFAIVCIFSSTICNAHNAPSNTDYLSFNDSSLINHKLDGIVDEWPVAKFSYDGETGMQYAIDNNSNNLYIALNIPDFKTQVKLMRQGMSLYIDLKAKKKEGNGVEFPVKYGNPDLATQSYTGGRTQRQNNDPIATQQQRKQEIKTVRKLLSLNLVQLKIFGLSDQFPDGQQLLLPGSVHIAFDWDSTDVMHIEYLIPLAMLADISSLNKKEIGIGIKIHAVEMPKAGEGGDNTGIENQSPGRGNGGYGGGNRRPGGFSNGNGALNNQSDRQKLMEDQKFWTKYTINLTAEKKAF